MKMMMTAMRLMNIRLAHPMLALLVATSPSMAQPPATDAPALREEFPAAEPESVGMTTAALKALDAIVQRYVERDEAVGAELMVIKNRRTVLHTAHGLRDKETGEAMKAGDISCIRSQTKSIVGTAIQMLIDDGKLKLDDPASRYIAAFDNDTHRAITIEQLLEHRSGLPLSSLMAVDHKALKGIQDVAELAGKAELEFAPGSDFNYSDDGTDSLTAIIEKVSGMPAAAFIDQRILQPLGMRDSICVLTKDDPRLARINALHAGGRGLWARFWSPTEDDPVFPYLLGSQSMYSTCTDYARLLCLWADDGVAPGGKRLLSHGAIARGLTAASDMDYPAAFRDLRTRYGQLWMLWTSSPAPDAENLAAEKVIAFGHGGSDGTIAWMWPEQDLIVMYYTQSRGGMTSVSIGPEVDRLLIRGEDPAAAVAAAGDRADFAGIYWNHEDEVYWAIWPGQDSERLTIEMQGRTVTDLDAAGAADTWKFAVNPSVQMRFNRDEQGKVVSLTIIPSPDRQETFQRIEPAADLPSVDVVVEKVIAAHGIHNIKGVIKRTGTIDMPALKTSGPYTSLLTADRMRSDFELRGQKTRVLVTPEGTWMKTGDTKAAKVEDSGMTEQMEWEDAAITFGDWRAKAKEITILKRVQRNDKPALLVRIVTHHSFPVSMVVDEESGRVLEQYRVANTPGLGALGAVTVYEDFKPIGPPGAPDVLLPWRLATTYATPMLGTATVTFDSAEVLKDAKIDELFAPDAP